MWLKLEHLPEHITGRQMFVVKAFDVIPFEGATIPYTSDPYCTWWEEGHPKFEFLRWPHAFKPTHFALLPEGRE